MGDQGLILFAHGAGDLRWVEPFDRVLGQVQERRPDIPATRAFLEHIAPDLPTAAGQLAARGVRRERVVPLFFARGGRLREEFSLLVQKAHEAAPTWRSRSRRRPATTPHCSPADSALAGME
jgi:sirohydrochlorin cobaltochelatase